jgi:RNA polymerase sigma factor (sigma-70 family)
LESRFYRNPPVFASADAQPTKILDKVCDKVLFLGQALDTITLESVNFPSTHWSLLAKATLNGEPEARRALEELCRRYWIPVDQFIRARGLSEAEAQDLTQEFMLHLLEKSTFARADPLRGRFRSFLLGALVRFLADAADRRRAQKRGGAIVHVSLAGPSSAIQEQVSVEGSAENLIFDREWGLTILETALNRLQREYAQAQRKEEFALLKNFLPGGMEPPSYDVAARQIGLSIATFKSQLHRLRRRLRSLVREEVAQTVSAPHEIDAEMAHLQEVLMDKGSEFSPPAET